MSGRGGRGGGRGGRGGGAAGRGGGGAGRGGGGMKIGGVEVGWELHGVDDKNKGPPVLFPVSE